MNFGENYETDPWQFGLKGGMFEEASVFAFQHRQSREWLEKSFIVWAAYMWLLWLFEELGCVGLIGGQGSQIFLHCHWLGFAFLVAGLREPLFLQNFDLSLQSPVVRHLLTPMHNMQNEMRAILKRFRFAVIFFKDSFQLDEETFE